MAGIELDRQKFEQEYRGWLSNVAKDVAQRLARVGPGRRDQAIGCYKRFLDPREIFCPASDMDRLKRLSEGEVSKYIMAETEAISFFPSVYTSTPEVLDFSVAMNRRYYYQGLWFPIISLNKEYVSRSPDKTLSFALAHEFEMSKIYQQLSLHLRAMSRGEKREIADTAQEASAARTKITQEDLIQDEKLMFELSSSQPLVPKPYAEMALLLYLEDNFSDLEVFGLKSRTEDEDAFGAELLGEFESWSRFTRTTYEIFVKEIIGSLRDVDRGYC